MKKLKALLAKIKIIHIILVLFFIFNLLILCSYPFVHSDEAWLSGLSRQMLESRSFSVTEPFFDLLPRNPHALKIFSYGENLGVLNSISTKLDRLDYFYQKIFYGVSGSYYIPPVKVQFIIFAATAILTLFKIFVKRTKVDIYLILSLIGINAAFILIGRYNQTGIIFIFPVFYFLILSSLKTLSDFNFKTAYTTALILLILISANTVVALKNDRFGSYQNYLNNIAKVVDSEDRVLANLNTDYYFERNKLFDYRNLAYLDENKLSFADYIEKNKIEYIIYPEEMDFIYNSRPQWNIMYGNLYPYYQDMKTFIENKTEKVYQFTDKTYAMRIVRYIGQKEWTVKIYRVKNTE